MKVSKSFAGHFPTIEINWKYLAIVIYFWTTLLQIKLLSICRVSIAYLLLSSLHVQVFPRGSFWCMRKRYVPVTSYSFDRTWKSIDVLSITLHNNSSPFTLLYFTALCAAIVVQLHFSLNITKCTSSTGVYP